MVKDMSEAKKYDRSYKEQSVKLALEIGEAPQILLG